MMFSKNIHINCDMAESYGNLKCGNDMTILPYIDAVNIACGFHGGDPSTIFETIKQAHWLNKQIGAHPSYPDLVGFGRRYMEMSDRELFSGLIYQISAVKGITESIGSKLSHVKPHGALYNSAYNNENVASVIADAVRYIDPELVVYAQQNSKLAEKASDIGLSVKFEGFADRRYQHDGTLAARTSPGAIISTPQDIKNHAMMLLDGQAQCIDGSFIHINAESICLHGDHPAVVQALELIRNQMS